MFNKNEYKYVSAGGYNIAYQRSGKGTSVLFVHGITTYSFIWRKLIPYLESKYDLIRVDLLGCGSSEMSVDMDLSLKNHAALLISFLKQLNIEKVHLVGHDLGGGIAQILSVRTPNRLLSVSLLNPVGYDYWPVQPITAMRTPMIRQLAMAAFDRGYYKTIVRKAIVRDANYTEELLDLFWSNFDNPRARKTFLQFAKCLNAQDILEISDDLKQLALPVLILCADKDVYLSKEITRRLHDDIPGSSLRIIPSSGHYIMEDAPEEISDHLLEFWKKIDG